MVSSTLAKRIKSLELLANPKEPMLILHCWEQPSIEQLAQIEAAERTGRRVIMFGGRYAWAWVSGSDDKPWLCDNSDYDFIGKVAA
ncbi:hypothetical protein ABXJ76_04210 [Methylobacter sp. G7]|uniref:hypothetical protein n=1 Tax=Methylobacter sp. G7 TaxID=3230117 RepID=UPI003D8098C3